MATILLVGNITRGVINWRLAPPPVVTEADVEQTIDGLFAPVDVEECAPAGTLFDMIEAAQEEAAWYEARLEELRDAMEDEEFNRWGC